MQERLERFFAHYNPDKIANIPVILKQFEGQEEELFATLVSKYGPEPPSGDTNNAVRDRLVRYFEAYNPSKLSNVEVILQQFAGKEEELFATLVGKYGPEPPVSNAPASDTAHDTYRDRLIRFFEAYNRNKIANVDLILEQYQGNEEELFATLVGKYGPEPGAEAKATPATVNEQPPLPSNTSNAVRDRLVRYFEAYNPSKLNNVDVILQQFAGKEEELFATLVSKYGPEPGTESKAAHTIVNEQDQPTAPKRTVPTVQDRRVKKCVADVLDIFTRFKSDKATDAEASHYILSFPGYEEYGVSLARVSLQFPLDPTTFTPVDHLALQHWKEMQKFAKEWKRSRTSLEQNAAKVFESVSKLMSTSLEQAQVATSRNAERRSRVINKALEYLPSVEEEARDVMEDACEVQLHGLWVWFRRTRDELLARHRPDEVQDLHERFKRWRRSISPHVVDVIASKGLKDDALKTHMELRRGQQLFASRRGELEKYGVVSPEPVPQQSPLQQTNSGGANTTPAKKLVLGSTPSSASPSSRKPKRKEAKKTTASAAVAGPAVKWRPAGLNASSTPKKKDSVDGTTALLSRKPTVSGRIPTTVPCPFRFVDNHTNATEQQQKQQSPQQMSPRRACTSENPVSSVIEYHADSPTMSLSPNRGSAAAAAAAIFLKPALHQSRSPVSSDLVEPQTARSSGGKSEQQLSSSSSPMPLSLLPYQRKRSSLLSSSHISVPCTLKAKKGLFSKTK
eukprot:PhM_4_TR17042/c0_g1_i1/m.34832